MISEEPRFASPSADYGPGRPRHHRWRHDATAITGIWVATVLAYAAQPVVALLWAGVAIAGAIAFLARGRPTRTPAIAALVLAGVGLQWTLVQLGALY